MKKTVLPALALGHGLNDLLAGYLLGSMVQSGQDILQISVGLFLYNLLAFGGQYPVALLLEKNKAHGKFLLLSYVLNIAAILSFFVLPSLAILLAGAGSAIYHVAGGSICAVKNKAVNIGVFAAPGVAGLILGGYLSYSHMAITNWLLAGAVIFLGFLWYLRPLLQVDNRQEALPSSGSKISFIDQHDILMMLLLTVIALRSAVWNVFQLLHENNYHWLGAIAIAAVVGKILGGWLADRIGWRLYAFISLLAAMPLLTIFKKEMILFCIGIGLLQSGIPATTSLLIQSMKQQSERAIGLSFGTAIILGAFIFYTPARALLLHDYSIWIIAALMGTLLIWSGRRKYRMIAGGR